MPLGTIRSNVASAVLSRCDGACTEACGRAGQVVCAGCNYAGLWGFLEEKAGVEDVIVQFLA